MKSSAASLSARFLLAVMAVAGFASCTVYDESYYAGEPRPSGGGYYAEGARPYGGGYYDEGYGYDGWAEEYYDYHPPVYRSYVTYGSAWPYYYGGRYYSYRWWNDDRYRGYCHDHGSNHDRYRKRRSSEEIKLVRYRGDDRGRLPSGYHSDQWYKDRGYSLKSNTYRERDGDLRGRRPSSSSSSSRDRDDDRRSSSSSSYRKRDDDRPTSDHPRAIRQPEKYRYTGSGGSSRDADRRRSSSSDRSNSSDHRKSSSSSSGRSQSDHRPTSEHPRAMRQPDKYRYTGSGGDGGDKHKGGSNKSKSKKD
jgi:hypothetical protein